MSQDLSQALARLQRLETEQSTSQISDKQDTEGSQRSQSASRLPSVHEGYGFRPASGTATPFTVSVQNGGIASPLLPDPYGLGWPGILISNPMISSHGLYVQQSQQCLA